MKSSLVLLILLAFLPVPSPQPAAPPSARTELTTRLFLPAVFQPNSMRTADMSTPRYRHSATLLPSGKVLVAGGMDGSGWNDLDTSEVYDPATNEWSLPARMLHPRYHHTATLLNSGKVLVVGGRNLGDTLASAELYDPQTDTWSAAASLHKPREMHSATLLLSGKVLVAGGQCGNNSLSDPLCVSGAEVYDPAADAWTWAASTGVPLMPNRALLLPSGDVLVMTSYYDSPVITLRYNPGTDTWRAAASLTEAGRNCDPALLHTGQVLVAGGLRSDAPGYYTFLPDASLYDPVADTWSPAAPLHDARIGHTLTTLLSGKVLLLGGFDGKGWRNLATAEVYDPTRGTWSRGANMLEPRYEHTATLLRTGQVLVVGGTGTTGGQPMRGAEVYDAEP